LQGRGIQFDEGFVKVRVELDVPVQPGYQDLMFRCFRKREVHRDVLADLRHAGQAEALRQLFGFQVLLLDAGGRGRPAVNPHPALPALSFATAGKVEIEPGEIDGVFDSCAGQDVDVTPGGLEGYQKAL